MSSGNGIVSNVQVKTFNGLQKIFGPFWCYLAALLMTMNLTDVLFPDFKNKLPVSEYAESQSEKEKEGCSKNIMVMGYFGITLTSPKWMIKVKNLKTKGWPSGCAYMVVEVPAETFLPKDMFLKAEQNTKLGQLKYKNGQNTNNYGTVIGGLEV